MKVNPSKIRLDASTLCQLKCPACPTTHGHIDKALGSRTLRFEDFKKLVDANRWIKSIELSNWGEIFLNRDLLKISEYAFENKILLNAAGGVNLNTIRDEMIEGLVKYQYGSVTCSIDGASPETYGIYRQGGDFNNVLANIRKINEYKAKYRSVLPKLNWQFVVFGHNEHEILLARQMAHKLDMGFYVKFSWGNYYNQLKSKDSVRNLIESRVTTRNEYQEKYKKVYLAETICSQLWKDPQINTDGRVLGCCVNYWGDYGNAFKEDLRGILNNERMNYARDMLLGKKMSRADVPCAQCHLYKEMKVNNTWLFSQRKKNEAFA